jgi:NtrC-family two-component system response regulator AlgB
MRFASERGRHAVAISKDALLDLQAYGWPGNIRELRNVLERALLLGGQEPVSPGDLRLGLPSASGMAQDQPMASLEDVERAHIAKVFEMEEHRVERAARRLGISTSSLYERLRKYGIPTGRSSPENAGPSRK